MRLLTYLSENKSTKSISEDKFFELLNSKCKDSLKGFPLYRGFMGNYDDLIFAQKRTNYRTAKMGPNLFNLLLDNSKSWSKYPKRGYSHICSSKYIGAAPYGDVYRVFPFDGTMLGVAPNNDIFWSFDVLSKSSNTRTFVEEIQNISELYVGKKIDDSSWSKAVKGIKELDKNRDKILEMLEDEKNREYYMEDDDVEVFISLYKKHNKFLDAFADYFNPNRNKFKLTKVGNKRPEGQTVREVWFEGPAIMIKLDNNNHDSERIDQFLSELLREI